MGNLDRSHGIGFDPHNDQTESYLLKSAPSSNARNMNPPRKLINDFLGKRIGLLHRSYNSEGGLR
jgi:hypothetical protein